MGYLLLLVTIWFTSCTGTEPLTIVPSDPVISQDSTIPEKYALLIGISQYPISSRWASLHGTNDVDLLSQTLLGQGFKEKNIISLKDTSATKNSILKALTYLASTIKKGDIVLVHFSGHGQQIADDNSDEIDGYDEAIVPYNSPKYYEVGVYEGENLIRDELLGEQLNKLRTKLGRDGHLLTLIDACHSGTGTRSWQASRGTTVKMASSTYQEKFTGENTNSETNTLTKENIAAEDNLASALSIFSAAPNQKSVEITGSDGKQYGILSYSFCKALSSIKEPTYHQLLEDIQLEMNKFRLKQQPQFEGQSERLIFNGTLLKTPDYFTVRERIGRNEIMVNAGQLHGFENQSTVELYATVEDIINGNILATGSVLHSTLLDSDIQVDIEKIAKEQLLSAKVVLKERSFKDLSIRVLLDIPTQKNSFEKIKQELIQYPVIQLVEEKPDFIIQSIEQKILLFDKNGDKLFSRAENEFAYYKLGRVILQQLQVKFLRSMELKDKDFLLDVQLVNKNNEEKTIFYKEGETLLIRIKNNGERPIYYQVLDIQPNNEFNIIIPSSANGELNTDCYIQPTEMHQREFVIYPPYGQELLKIITTDKPLLLEPIITSRGSNKQSNTNPFEQLMQASYLQNNKRGVMSSIGVDRVNVSSMTFTIAQKQSELPNKD